MKPNRLTTPRTATRARIQLLSMLLAMLALPGCHSSPEKGTVTYYWFEYEGKDTPGAGIAAGESHYLNPILPGFYPDPSICRKGRDYYLVNSTFAWYPGIPLFHSTDLVHWRQLGHVLDRPGQLNLDSLGVSEGVFAPAISYNPANETFYLVNTLVGKGGNFVVKARDPAGPWSDPVWLPEAGGIDPSLFFDDDGRAWLVHNDIPPGEPQYDGHRAIHLREYDLATDRLKGEGRILVDGGSDIRNKPVWIEGPHLYKVNGTYYLMAAEGGTAENHSEVIFTAPEIGGPYTPAAINPILTQRDLPEDRGARITCTGHADLTDTPEGDWYAVFLGCRPYLGNHYNLGRETFLLPVRWENRQPVILPRGEAVPLACPLPVAAHQTGKETAGQERMQAGNFTFRDEFDTAEPDMSWNFLRTPREKWYWQEKGELRIACRPETLLEKGNPSLIGRRQQHNNFTATVSLAFRPEQPGQKAGLMLFQNERHYYFLGVEEREGKLDVFLEQYSSGDGRIPGLEPRGNIQRLSCIPAIAKPGKEILLQITGEMPWYHFRCSPDGQNWIQVDEKLTATFLSTTTAGGFVGTYIALYAAGEN